MKVAHQKVFSSIILLQECAIARSSLENATLRSNFNFLFRYFIMKEESLTASPFHSIQGIFPFGLCIES